MMAKVYKELRDTKGCRLNEHLYKRRLLSKTIRKKIINNNSYKDLQAKYDDMLFRNGLCLGFIQKQGLEDKFIEHMKQVATYEEDQRYRVAAVNFLSLLESN
ncbi:hypothetical protein A7313_17430 [Bacillus velezensis]|nr:hypothetical protein A7313_17430 [Bacillus velezensis]